MSRGDQRIKEWPQLKGSSLPYGFNFKPFADAHSLTVDTITAVSDSETFATVTDEVTGNSAWAGIVNALSEGLAEITLTATFVGSNVVRKRRFRVNVTDPDF